MIPRTRSVIRKLGLFAMFVAPVSTIVVQAVLAINRHYPAGTFVLGVSLDLPLVLLVMCLGGMLVMQTSIDERLAQVEGKN